MRVKDNMINEQAILNIKYQTALLEHQAAEEKLTVARLPKAALERIRHALVLTHGMIATDIPSTVADTDANKNTCFVIDHENEIADIDGLLAVSAPDEAESPQGKARVEKEGNLDRIIATCQSAAPPTPACPTCGSTKLAMDWNPGQGFTVQCLERGYDNYDHFWDALELADFAQFFPAPAGGERPAQPKFFCGNCKRYLSDRETALHDTSHDVVRVMHDPAPEPPQGAGEPDERINNE